MFLYLDRSCTILSFQLWQCSKVCTQKYVWAINYFHSYSLFPIDKTLHTYHYFITISMANVQMFHQFRPSQLGSPHAMYIVSNQSHFHYIPLVRKKPHSNSIFLETVILWNRFLRGCFPDKYKHNFFKFRAKWYLLPFPWQICRQTIFLSLHNQKELHCLTEK